MRVIYWLRKKKRIAKRGSFDFAKLPHPASMIKGIDNIM